MQNVTEIAGASLRNEGLQSAAADCAATTINDGVSPKYSFLTDPDEADARVVHCGDMWHCALARMVFGARANGVGLIDRPLGDLQDPDGCKAAVSLDGQLVVIASIRQAEILVERAKQIAGG
jgi:malyl-CoA/(S)-citramalyl-CoA lyase